MKTFLLNFISSKPNSYRVIYDFSVSLVFSFFSIIFTYSIRGLSISFTTLATGFLGPLTLITALAALGTYTKHRNSNFRIKFLVITIAMLCSAASYFLLFRDSAIMVIWCALSWLPLVMPRYFLNFKNSGRSLVSHALTEKGPVLVVGGAGYIGSHTVGELLKNGFRVRVLDKLLYGDASLKPYLANPKFELIIGDATDLVKLNTAISGSSAVVHLAGLVGDPACAVDKEFTRHTNIVATRMVHEAAISFGITRFIFASSCSVYGIAEQKVSETSTPNPVSLYATSKLDSEKELLSSANEETCLTILRFATVFGHSARPRFDLVTNFFTAQALIDGRITLAGSSQWRPFIHVHDLARAICLVLKSPKKLVGGQIFNVGDENLNMTIGDVAQMVKDVVSAKRNVEIIEDPNWKDNRNYHVSFEKIRSSLGFEAKTLMHAGIQEIAEALEAGKYAPYKSPEYSNLEMTKVALNQFMDPQLRAKLYTSLAPANHL